MTARLSGHFSIFGLAFFELKSLLGIARQYCREKFAILSKKSQSHDTERWLLWANYPCSLYYESPEQPTTNGFTDAPSIKPDHATWNVTRTVLFQIELCIIFCGLYYDCVQIQSWVQMTVQVRSIKDAIACCNNLLVLFFVIVEQLILPCK